LPDWSLGTAYEALGRGDSSPLLALLGEGFEWVEPELPGYPLAGVHRGALEVRTRVMEGMERLLEGLTIEGEEMVEAGSRVVVTGLIRGRPAGADEDWELPFSHVWEIAPGGRPERVRTYFDRSRLTLAASRRELSSAAEDLLQQAAEIRRQWDRLGDTLRAAGSDSSGDDEDDREETPGERASSARLAAVDMASDGATREEVAAYLRDDLGIEEPDAILDDVFPEPAAPTEPETPAAPLDEQAAAMESTRLGRLFARNRE
jgi:ketosteroid isomerase-like protein